MFVYSPWNNKFLIGYLALFFRKSLQFPTYHCRGPSASSSIKSARAARSAVSAHVCLAAPLPGTCVGGPGDEPTSSSVSEAVRTLHVQLAFHCCASSKADPPRRTLGMLGSHTQPQPPALPKLHTPGLRGSLWKHTSLGLTSPSLAPFPCGIDSEPPTGQKTVQELGPPRPPRLPSDPRPHPADKPPPQGCSSGVTSPRRALGQGQPHRPPRPGERLLGQVSHQVVDQSHFSDACTSKCSSTMT